MVSVALRSLYCAMKDRYCELVPLCALCRYPIVVSFGRRWKRTGENRRAVRRFGRVLNLHKSGMQGISVGLTNMISCCWYSAGMRMGLETSNPGDQCHAETLRRLGIS